MSVFRSLLPVSVLESPDRSKVKPVLFAYRMAAHGFRGLGWSRAQKAFQNLKGAQASSAEVAVAAVLVGEMARGEGHWSEAARFFSEAARSLLSIGSQEAAAAALARGLESVVIPGKSEEAERLWDDFRREGRLADWSALPEAVIALAKGDAGSARDALKRLPAKSGDPWARCWTDLYKAETFLEVGSLAGADASLGKVKEAIAPEWSTAESHLRYAFLRAWHRIDTLWGAKGEEPSKDDLAAAAELVEKLAKSAKQAPLYLAWGEHFGGEVALLSNASSERAFAEALRIADAAGAIYPKACMLARQAAKLPIAAERAAEGRRSTARSILTPFGATKRVDPPASGPQHLGATKRVDPSASGPQHPVREDAGRKSVMRRSMSVAIQRAQDLDLVLPSAESTAGPAGGASSVRAGDGPGEDIEAVMEVSRYLSTILKLDELLEKILSAVVRVTRAERGAILREFEKDRFEYLTVKKISRERSVSDDISMSVVRTARDEGEAILTDNALSDVRFRDRESVLAQEIRSVLCAPLRTKNQTLGFIYLDRRVQDRPFTEDQKDLLAIFCVQAAVAWENALAFEQIEGLNASLEQKVEQRTRELNQANKDLEKYIEELTNTRLKLAEAERDAMEQEMRLAREVQKSLLPPVESIVRKGVSFAGQVISASYCGGDWWTYADIRDQKILFVIVDVTGHGLGASLLTAVAKSCIDTLGRLDNVSSADSLLEVLNDVVHRSARGELLATAFACVIDPEAKTIRYANAGHCPPLFGRPGAAPKPLLGRGSRIGELESVRFQTHDIGYSEGDRLLLYTDGIVECKNAKQVLYGARRLAESYQRHVQLAPLDMLKDLVNDATQFSGGAAWADDLTLVVVDLK